MVPYPLTVTVQPDQDLADKVVVFASRGGWGSEKVEIPLFDSPEGWFVGQGDVVLRHYNGNAPKVYLSLGIARRGNGLVQEGERINQSGWWLRYHLGGGDWSEWEPFAVFFHGTWGDGKRDFLVPDDDWPPSARVWE